MSKYIRGTGGGGKGGGGTRAAVEAPDSLKSKQFARVVDLISEGEIEGFVTANPLQSIYLNDTPVVSPAGQVNFPGFTINAREGTQAQNFVPGFSEVENEVSVSTQVTKEFPVTRSIVSSSIDAARVTISVPRLFRQDPSTGDINGTSVRIQIQRQSAGGGYQTIVDDTIRGKTSSRYQRSYRIPLTGSAPWDIRVVRVTNDAPDQSLQNETFWDSYTEIVEAKLRYPNSAFAAMAVDSEQFNAIPSRGFHIRGIKVKIPTNYDPITREYNGIWDGNFTTAWTNNPAWIFYDLMTNERYGLGSFIKPEEVDKWQLYDIARYCDEPVNDGFGGTEPRFTCNTYIQSREEAYKVINAMASVFRAIVYWADGKMVPVQDKPEDVVALFNNSNVVDGNFNYAGSSGKVRHTVALVSWNDPADLYRSKIEYVEDQEAIRRLGIIEKEVVALGCTSRGQAHRFGKWILISEQIENDTVSFRVGLDSTNIYPGAIIQTQDPFRSGRRNGGRILSATNSSITIDNPVQIEPNKIYQISFFLPNGEIVTSTIPVEQVSSEKNVLNLATPVSEAPLPESIWVLTDSDLIPQTWRVVSINQVEKNMADVTAIAHRPDKFAAVEENLVLEPLPTSLISLEPESVTDLRIVETPYLVSQGIVGNRVVFSWTSNASLFRVEVDGANINPFSFESVTTAVNIDNLSPGVYTFNVTPINRLGRIGNFNSISVEIRGLQIRPPNVTGFRLNAISDNAYLQWDATDDLATNVGGHAWIRYSTDKIAPTWNDSVTIGPRLSGNSSNATLPLLEGSYLIKWVNVAGLTSEAPAIIKTDAPRVIGLNFYDEIIEQPDFPGEKINVVVDPILGATICDGTGECPENPFEGEYYFEEPYNLGSIRTVRLIAKIKTIAYLLDNLVDNFGLIDSLEDIDGSLLADVNAELQVRTTQVDPALEEWGDWEPFAIGDYKARGFDFRVLLSREELTHNIAVNILEVEVDLPDRLLSDEDVTSLSTVQEIIFDEPYFLPPALGITAQEMQTGDYYEITDKTNEGFKIIFKNASGTPVIRTYDWIAKGF